MNNRLKFKAYWKDTGKEIEDFMEEYSLCHLDDDDIDIVQCTGVKDINGKLIYEGYIIKEGDGHIQEVEWDEEYAGYGFHTKHYSYEILGNIYQNPELLKK